MCILMKIIFKHRFATYAILCWRVQLIARPRASHGCTTCSVLYAIVARAWSPARAAAAADSLIVNKVIIITV